MSVAGRDPTLEALLREIRARPELAGASGVAIAFAKPCRCGHPHHASDVTFSWLDLHAAALIEVIQLATQELHRRLEHAITHDHAEQARHAN